MAHRAGHAVCGKGVVGIVRAAQRQVIKNPPLASRRSVRERRHRHVADRALVFDVGGRRRVIHHLSPHRSHPIRIASGVGHHRGAPVGEDRHVFTRRRHHVVVADAAGIGRDEKSSRSDVGIRLGGIRKRPQRSYLRRRRTSEVVFGSHARRLFRTHHQRRSPEGDARAGRNLTNHRAIPHQTNPTGNT